MTDERKFGEPPRELLERVGKVTNKRARFVLDSIVKNGRVTTEEPNQAGYEHPPRAAQDAKDLGFGIKTIKVKHSNGRSIGAYVFAEGELDPDKRGRRPLPKKERDALIAAAGKQCQMCGAEHNLQVDHRVPYEVAGDTQAGQESPYQILDGVCNRKKSWACEYCENRLTIKKLDTCRSCYWAMPDAYTHIAMKLQRRADLVWSGEEVNIFEMLKEAAIENKRSVPEQIKAMIESDLKRRPWNVAARSHPR